MGSDGPAKVSATEGGLAKPERDRLVEAHMPLVHSVARRYAGRGAELEDLVQVGALGLLSASERFDPQRGVTFGSFAAPTVEGAIRHHLRKLANTNQPVAPDEIPEGISALVGTDDRLLLRSWLRELGDRDRQIVYLRFHADMTEADIGSELGLSQAQVSRLLAEALVQLREVSGSPAASERVSASAAPPSDPPAPPLEPAPPAASEHASTAQPNSREEPGHSHSGRFLVRMDGVLHERLSDAAKHDHVSLNRFVTERLAESLSPARSLREGKGVPDRRLRVAMIANIVIIVLASAAAIALVALAINRGL
jgi:RNA polymerase sigma-B factor